MRRTAESRHHSEETRQKISTGCRLASSKAVAIAIAGLFSLTVLSAPASACSVFETCKPATTYVAKAKPEIRLMRARIKDLKARVSRLEAQEKQNTILLRAWAVSTSKAHGRLDALEGRK
jgi:hypothetical protein